jgi:hypothetical protein
LSNVLNATATWSRPHPLLVMHRENAVLENIFGTIGTVRRLEKTSTLVSASDTSSRHGIMVRTNYTADLEEL